jgi:hypothetical protein
METDAYMVAKIAVAASYMDEIEEYFRSYEGEGAGSALPPAGEEMPDMTMGSEGDEDMDMEDDDEDMEPGESTDDETEDEVEGSTEEGDEEE